MNFNAPLLRPIRILLFPFSLIYAFVAWLRNMLYDKNVFTPAVFNLPLICVGNLSTGGTGKSPMVEFIVRHLREKGSIAVLSRGYKRKTAGYALADEFSTALEIGDEPMLFHNKFPDVTIAVGEERVVAIPQLLQDKPETNVIILDDAFQHRSVKAGLNILLTDYNNLFTRDWFLPTGDLRDERRSYKRAQLLVVTKCPPTMSEDEAVAIKDEINPVKGQEIFFTCIRYDTPYHIVNGDRMEIDDETEVLLVTGIANPRTIKNYLSETAATYYEMLYDDHHIFSIDDWKEIARKFKSMTATKKLILTTEKDAVRLVKFDQELKALPLYVMPMKVHFLYNSEQHYINLITTFINGFSHHTIKQLNGQKEF